MQKNYDELIYYDPKKFHEAEMKELAIEKNNLAIAKELIKNGELSNTIDAIYNHPLAKDIFFNMMCSNATNV